MNLKCSARIVSTLFFVTACLGVCLIFSCAGGAPKRTPSVLTERPERMFWELNGTDAQGKNSTVYVQGTISFSDSPLLNSLEPAVLAAYEQANLLVAEISSRDFAALEGAIQKQVLESASLDKKVTDFRAALSAEENAQLVKALGTAQVESLALYEPWVTVSLLNKAFYALLPFNSGFGLDAALIKKAVQDKRDFAGLDSLKTQLSLLTLGSYTDQLFLLTEKLSAFKTVQTQTAVLQLLHSAYIDNDKNGYAAIAAEQRIKENAQDPVYATYNKRLQEDRNTDWANKIDDLLLGGGTTFVFADLSHFVGKQSVFEYMETAGTLVRGEHKKTIRRL